MKPEIEYLADDTVDDALDQELRGLLASCFTKPQDVVFRDRRYFREPYPHRWVMRDKRGLIVSHVGVHEKQIESGGHTYRIGGIAEVCVHPAHRGNGYVRMMLKCIHEWLTGRGIVFAVLFGDARVYGSSGYVQVANLFRGGGDEGWTKTIAMIRELSGTSLPHEDMHLPGPEF